MHSIDNKDIHMSTVKSSYIRGLWAGAPFLIMAMPFGMLFGVVATEAGFDMLQTMAMTMVDLFENEQLVAEVKEEFRMRKGDEIYEAMIDGPPPISQN